jgi:hypothetical protein
MSRGRKPGQSTGGNQTAATAEPAAPKRTKRETSELRAGAAIRALRLVEQAAKYSELTESDREQIGNAIVEATNRAISALKTGKPTKASSFRLSGS